MNVSFSPIGPIWGALWFRPPPNIDRIKLFSPRCEVRSGAHFPFLLRVQFPIVGCPEEDLTPWLTDNQEKYGGWQKEFHSFTLYERKKTLKEAKLGEVSGDCVEWPSVWWTLSVPLTWHNGGDPEKNLSIQTVSVDYRWDGISFILPFWLAHLILEINSSFNFKFGKEWLHFQLASPHPPRMEIRREGTKFPQDYAHNSSPKERREKELEREKIGNPSAVVVEIISKWDKISSLPLFTNCVHSLLHKWIPIFQSRPETLEFLKRQHQSTTGGINFTRKYNKASRLSLNSQPWAHLALNPLEVRIMSRK